MSARLLSRPPVWIAAFAAATIAFYFWYASACFSAADARPLIVAPADSPILTGAATDLYALQARGFLKGQLALDLAPPPRGIPYLHDASYFGGKYYMYFGPAPALLAFLPFRMLTGHDLAAPMAVPFFCSLAYLAMLALWLLGTGSESLGTGSKGPTQPFSLILAVMITLGGASLLLPLLRRPAAYEVAISAGSVFFLWSLYFLFRLRRTRAPLGCAVATGLLLGLAVASRPTYLLSAAPFAAGVLLLRRERTNAGKRADLAAASAALGAILILLAAYNGLRFGSVFEFGRTYQLASALPTVPQMSLANVPFQLKTYLVSGLSFTRYFPFIHTLPPAPFRAEPPEFTFGVFANLPVALFALIALGGACASRKSAASRAVWLLGGVFAATLLPALIFFGSCVRYMADFTPTLMLLASLGLGQTFAWLSRRRPGLAPWFARLACATALWSFGVVFFASVDMYDDRPEAPPAALERLGSWFSRPLGHWDAAHGRAHGPRRILVVFPREPAGREPLVTASDSAGHWDALSVDPVGGQKVRFLFLRDGPEPIDVSSSIDIGPPGAVHTLILSMGALLPPRPGELPYPLPSQSFAALRTWLHLELDGKVVWETPILPRSLRLEHAGLGRFEDGASSKRFSGEIKDVQIVSATAITLGRPQLAGVAVRLELTPAMAGRSFPVVSTGQIGTGNFLIMSLGRDGRLRFGYDHWGKPTLWSPAVAIGNGAGHSLEFWMPSILGHNPPDPLVVKWDGRTVWREAVPYFPADRNQIFLGRNPIGGSTSESILINARYEALDLASPE